MVLHEGLGLTLAGIAAGLLGAFATTRLMVEILFDVSPTDPVIFVAVPVLLGLVALFASWIPTRRAVPVPPLEAIRNEWVSSSRVDYYRYLERALLSFNALEARQWVADAQRSGFIWTEVPAPLGLDSTGLAIAAGVAELLAARAAQSPRSGQRASPRHPLRRRGLFAPPDFLSIK